MFVGGVSVVNVGGLVLRNSSDGRIRGMQMQTFFGGEASHDAAVITQLTLMFAGSDSSWASPTDQYVWFSDFSVAITETL